MEDRLKIINDILDGSSNRLRESYFMKNNNDIYHVIIDFTKNIDIDFKQKLWHWVNNKPDYIKCACGNNVSFNKNWQDGYRYGCSSICTQKNPQTKEKRKKTCLKVYGTDNVAKNEDIKLKIEKTNIEIYGTKSTFQSEEVKLKWRKNMLDKHGVDHYFKTTEFKTKAKKYYLEKWGVVHQSLVYDIQQKIQNTCLDKYGVNSYLKTQHAKDSVKVINRSSYEYELSDWLTSLNIKHVMDSNLISPLKLDIFIESAKLAIEFNGLWWHNEYYKDKKYHLNKTNLCEEKGVSLLHIWEDDWLNRKEVYKSIILNKIGIIEDRIYARKCELVYDLSNDDVSSFLNANHVQGYCKYSTSIGLKVNNELISLMTFGWRSINAKREYELLRFVNKKNISVIGSATKLFTNFIKNNKDIDCVSTYSDISMFGGGVYSKMGFNRIGNSGINYWWVVDGIRRHRFTYNKSKLVKQGFDPLKTEVEIMHSRGYYRVYGCGQDKWQWIRN